MMTNQFVIDLQESFHSIKVEGDKPHKRNFLSKAVTMYGNLLIKVEEFFTQMSPGGIRQDKELVKGPMEEQNAISECEHAPLKDHDIHSFINLKDTTKEVMSKILTVCKEVMGENAVCETSPAVSAQDSNVILQLEACFASAESPVHTLSVDDETESSSRKLIQDEGKLSVSRSEILSGAVLWPSETPAEAPAGQHVCINMDDVTEKESSPISRQKIVGVVNTISTELDVENGQCSTSPSQDLTSLDERLERLLSNERLTAFAHNLAEQVHYLFLLDQKRKAINKSASDSALLNMGQSCSLSKMDNIREAIQIYAEETVKNFFLPCFNIPAPWNIDVGRFLPQASSSVSCPSFLYSMYEIIPQGACRSPPQVLQSTIQTLTAVTVRDIMNSLPQEEQAVQEPLPDSERVFSRPPSGVSEVCAVSPDIVTESRELIQTSVQLTPKEKKTKRQRFRFLPKMSKVKAFFNLKLKRSKSGNCAGEQSTNLDLDLNPTSSAHGDTILKDMP
ncbi:uncharacterized protein LOC134063596 [Sardina pilchardus]|uniref:uncharacterized protein LOC134063596 n=1 Tax=Sardina pilchardus TaxID=27697 RepID=UPI002E0F1A84